MGSTWEPDASGPSEGASAEETTDGASMTSGMDEPPEGDEESTGEPELDGSTGVEGSSSSGERDVPPPLPPHVVYVNGSGPTMAAGTDDATTDTWFLGGGALDPFQTPELLPTVVEGLEEAFAGLNVAFVLERPMDGDYTMAIVTPTNLIGGFALGVGQLDCGNENPNSVVAAFSDGAYTAESVATVLARELGYGYGLDRVNNDADFMRASPGFGGEFTDDCVEVEMGGMCTFETCPSGQVNTFAELEALLGSG